MPTYVYECSSCNKQFEIEQRITENSLDKCLCGSNGTVKRIMQPIAVMFKGSGFHVNDYAASTKEPSKVEKPEDAPIPASADAVEKSKPLEAVGEAPAAAPPSTSAPAPSTGNSESTT